MGVIAGADGCRGGWIVAQGSLAGGPVSLTVVPTLRDFLQRAPDLRALAIDMPIGLPDRIGPGGRGPESALRPLLGQRQSSVFSIPARSAVYASTYAEACAASLAASDPPRKVSKQAFFLFPKMREIDELLREGPEWRGRIHEAHPEGSFRMMKGRPLDEPKKAKGQVHGPGLAERRALLLGVGMDAGAVTSPRPGGAGEDDRLDALALLWTAGRILRGEAVAHRGASVADSYGLPLTIWT